jgi:hypothetical protein
MSRRTLSALAVFLALGAGAAVPAAGGGAREKPKEEAFEQKFEKLKAGILKLKEADVVALFGPAGELTRPGHLDSDLQMQWDYSTRIWVTFQDGKVREVTGAFSDHLPVPRVTPAQFRRLRVGMAEKEVLDVLGESNGKEAVGNTVRRAWGRFATLRVSFDKNNRLVHYSLDSRNSVLLPDGLNLPGGILPPVGRVEISPRRPGTFP